MAEGERQCLAWQRAAPGAGLFAAAALAMRLALPLGPDRTGAAFAVVFDLVPDRSRAQPALNEYGRGGQLIFQDVRPFVDSRADLYGDAFLARYHRIAAGQSDALNDALTAYGIPWTIFPSGHPVIPLSDRMPRRRRLIEADWLVVHASD